MQQKKFSQTSGVPCRFVVQFFQRKHPEMTLRTGPTPRKRAGHRHLSRIQQLLRRQGFTKPCAGLSLPVQRQEIPPPVCLHLPAFPAGKAHEAGRRIHHLYRPEKADELSFAKAGRSRIHPLFSVWNSHHLCRLIRTDGIKTKRTAAFLAAVLFILLLLAVCTAQCHLSTALHLPESRHPASADSSLRVPRTRIRR